IQVFDKDMNVVDDWRHFGRPSNVWVLRDDTVMVSDSESNNRIGGPDDAPEGGGNAIRNPGWKNGIRIGSATDRSRRSFIDGPATPDGRKEFASAAPQTARFDRSSKGRDRKVLPPTSSATSSRDWGGGASA